MSNTTLGLDLGFSSIGWALVETGNDESPSKIVAAGSRVFPEGVDLDRRTGNITSKNAQRRLARSARRGIERRGRRLNALKNDLIRVGLWPTDETELQALLRLSPYELRAKALDERLSPHEIGRAIYALAHRRGYKSNRISDGEATGSKDNDGKKALADMNALADEMASMGVRTLGEYQYRLQKSGERVRGRFTKREMLLGEYKAIWSAQEKYYPEILNNDLKNKVWHWIFFQRPLKPQSKYIGKCELEPRKRRARRGSWYAQRFIMLQKINDLKILDTHTGEIRPLTSEDREKLISEIGRREKLEFDQIRKLLELPGHVRFNSERSASEKMVGNPIEWELRQVFKKRYSDLDIHTRDEVVFDLIHEGETDTIRRHAADKWGLDNKQTERLFKVRVPKGHLKLSERAIKKLLPFLEEGYKYSEAKERAGYSNKTESDHGSSEFLPQPPEIRNPGVSRCLGELRKVVNAIIREYGKPDRANIELARDMRLPRKERDRITRQQKENKSYNDRAREQLSEAPFKIKEPSGNDVLRFKLWEECGHRCPYTGQTICAEELFNGKWDIEHIIPFHRSLDDSYMNKTLCLADENRNVKKNMTPFEAYDGSDGERWAQITKRVEAMAGMPWPKKRRFLRKEIDLEQNITRLLNDTRYASREARDYLATVLDPQCIDVANGRATGLVRRCWGLNTLLGDDGEKNRNDHRHHAVDAIVIALTSRAMLKKLSDANKLGYGDRIKFDQPWADFRDDVEKVVKAITISHRSTRRVRGQIHKDTVYGIEESGERRYKTIRKTIDELTEGEAKNIADPVVRAIVAEHRNSPGSGHPVLPNRNGPPVPVKRVKVRVPIDSKQAVIEINRGYVDPAEIHHIVICESVDGKKWNYVVVKLIDAIGRVRSGQSPVQPNPAIGKVVMVLHKNDMIELRDAGDKNGVYRVQKIGSNGQVTIRRHWSNDLSDKDSGYRPRVGGLKKTRACQVSVDPIGQVTIDGQKIH